MIKYGVKHRCYKFVASYIISCPIFEIICLSIFVTAFSYLLAKFLMSFL